MKTFCLGVVLLLGEEYLRKPNQADDNHLLQDVEARDFLSILRCIDIMHWKRKNFSSNIEGAI